jgi:hypothetical protein
MPAIFQKKPRKMSVPGRLFRPKSPRNDARRDDPLWCACQIVNPDLAIRLKIFGIAKQQRFFHPIKIEGVKCPGNVRRQANRSFVNS